MKNAIALRKIKHAGKTYAKGSVFRMEPQQLDEWAAVGLVRPQAVGRTAPAAEPVEKAVASPDAPRKRATKRKPAAKKAD